MTNDSSYKLGALMSSHHKLFTPKGLYNTAQGKRSAALGYRSPKNPNPERVAQKCRRRTEFFVQPLVWGFEKEKISSSFTLQFLPHCLFGDPFFLRRQFMATRSRRSVRKYLIQKPNGQVTQRVQAVGPEHFGVLCFDCAKARSKFMLANFYGSVLIPPQTVAHTRGHLQAVIDQVRQACAQYQLRDLIVAIERTGEYHRPVQRACKQANFDTRLVHPLTSKQFRVPADPGNKTDDTDLAAIFRAAVNGFGLVEPVLPEDYQQLQL